MMSSQGIQTVHETENPYHCTTCDVLLEGDDDDGCQKYNVDHWSPMEVCEVDETCEEANGTERLAPETVPENSTNDVEMVEDRRDETNSFECMLCGSKITKHVPGQLFVGYTLYNCSQCGMEYSSGDTALEMPAQHNNDDSMATGDGIDDNTTNVNWRRRYDNIRTDVKLFKCQNCAVEFTTETMLQHHFEFFPFCSPEQPKPVLNCSVINSKLQYQCIVCRETFGTVNSLLSHEVANAGKGIFPCSFTHCDRVFHNQKDCQEHKKHHGVFKCPLCDNTFAQRNDLLRHERAQHQRGIVLPCIFCRSIFSNQDDYEEHQKIHGASCKMKLHCQKCKMTFNRRIDLLRHEKDYHHKKILYECQTCGEKFVTHRSLASHANKWNHQGYKGQPLPFSKTTQENAQQQRHNKESTATNEGKTYTPYGISQYQCKTCDEAFDTLSSLEWHESIYIGKSPFPCSLSKCKKVFHTQSDLQEHQQSHKPKCRFCGEVFSHRSSLTRHEKKAHPGEKAYACDVCGESFIRHFELTKHMKLKSHQVAKPQIIPTSGPASFETDSTRAQQTKQSNRDVAQQRPTTSFGELNKTVDSNGSTGHLTRQHQNAEARSQFMCTICNMTFEKGYDIREHIWTHPNVKQSWSSIFVEAPNAQERKDYTDQLAMINGALKPFRCAVCGKSFTCSFYLDEHFKTHVIVSNRNFLCDLCDKAFTTLVQLASHRKLHSYEKPYFCSICNGSYKTKRGVAIHIRETHVTKENGILNCPLCTESFTGHLQFQEHAAQHAVTQKLSCTICESSFIWDYELREHMKTDHRTNTCTVCGKTLVNKSDMMKHMRIHSDEEPYICAICNRTFRTKHKVTTHLRLAHITSESDILNCPVCYEQFSSNLRFEVHALQHVLTNKLSCAFCANSFAWKHELDDHIKTDHRDNKRTTHTEVQEVQGKEPEKDIGSFDCTLCDKIFKTKNDLIEHLSVAHLDQRPCVCTACGKCCVKKSNLVTHMRHAHLRKFEEKFQCVICSVSFKSLDQFHDHCLKHSVSYESQEVQGKDSEFCCTFCNKTFKTKHRLMIHSRTHTYVCTGCGASFEEKSPLLTHMRYMHLSALRMPGLAYECTLCYKSLKSIEDFHIHGLEHHSATHGLSCTRCDSSFTGKEELDAHMKKYHEKSSTILPSTVPHSTTPQLHMVETDKSPDECIAQNTIPRPACSGSFTSQSELEEHMEKHYDEKMFPCSGCGQKFSSAIKAAMHAASHPPKFFSCTKCDEAFETPKSLELHTNDCIKKEPGNQATAKGDQMEAYQNDDKNMSQFSGSLAGLPYKCEVCTRSFAEEGTLMFHQQIHEGASPFTCDMCGKTFPDRDVLVKHVGKHEESKGLPLYENNRSCKCSVCGMGFASQEKLSAHMFAHRDKVDTKLFKCKTCKGEFTDKTLLQHHFELFPFCAPKQQKPVVTYSATKYGSNCIYQCTACNKLCRSRYDLDMHIKVHRTDTVSCTKCRKSFPHGTDIDLHMKTCIEDSHVCPVCDASISTTTGFKTHMLNHGYRAHTTGSLEPNEVHMVPGIATTAARVNKIVKPNDVRITPRTVSEKKVKLEPEPSTTATPSILKTLAEQDKGAVIPSIVNQGNPAEPPRSAVELPVTNRTGDVLFQCTCCNKLFGNKEEMIVHMKTHNTQLTTRNSAVKNLKIHTVSFTKDSLTCDLCNLQFESKKSLQGHLCHVEGNLAGATNKDLDASKRAAIPEVLLEDSKQECAFCDQSFDTKLGLTMHLGNHHKVSRDGEGYRCVFCKFKIESGDHLKYHMMIHRGELPFLPFMCAECGQPFMDTQSFDLHRRLHAANKTFSCPVCHKRFSTMVQRQAHIAEHKFNITYFCDICKKTFKFIDERQKTKHMMEHNVKNCFEFALPSQLTAGDQKITQTREKPHEPLVGKVKTEQQHVEQNGALVFTVHQCDGCGKVFVDENTLKQHKVEENCKAVSTGVTHENAQKLVWDIINKFGMKEISYGNSDEKL